MRLVRWLFGLAVLATVLWCGYWFAGSRALELAIDQALADFDSPLSAEDRRIAGFPNRFDVTLTAPRVSLPGLAWSAPFVQVFALSYRPHHLVLVFPPEQRLDLPGGDWRLRTSDGRASAVFAPARRLELDRVVVVLREARLSGPLEVRAEALRLALRPVEPGLYEAVAEFEDALPDPAMMDRIDPARDWPRLYSVLRLEAELAFDRPLDADALLDRRLPPPQVVLTGARVAWPGVDLRLSGRVDTGAIGGPAGEMVLAIEGWPQFVALLDRAGALTDELRFWINGAGPALARPDAPDSVDIPLRIEAGQVRLGPMVLFDLGAG
jgi:hypothetical protein